MKHYATIIQDEAMFTIDEPQNQAEKTAAEIIAEYDTQFEFAKQQAYDLFPTKISFVNRTVKNELEFRAEMERLMKGYSYNSDNGVETWEVPGRTLIAKYVGSPGAYLRKFEFEIFE